MLPVNELFETIQGEATLTGTPAVFIRLQGCDVGCPWCDTKHTWDIDAAARISFAEMVAKVDPAPTFALVDPRELVASLDHLFAARHVVITGGEPCLHDLEVLTALLIEQGRTVQVETSGTEPVRVHPATWVTLSPKLDMPGGKAVRADAVLRANELKFPVGKEADVSRLLGFLDAFGDPDFEGGVWLQPLSRSPKATELCIRAARAQGWRISVQVHALIGVR